MRRVFMLIAGIVVGILLLHSGGLSHGPEETGSQSPPRQSPSEIPRSPIAGIPFNNAVEIYQRHRKDLEQLPGVSAVGLSTEGIFVSTTTPSNLPSQVEGIPITVVPADHPGVSCGPE